MTSNIFKSNNFFDIDKDQNKILYQPKDVVNATLYDYTFDNNFKETSQNTALLFIDSADRDKEKYPNNSHYRINLKKTYKDIIYIRLKLAQFPNSIFLIHSGNNKLYFQETKEQVEKGIVKVATIPYGDYTLDGLIEILYTELNKVSCGHICVEIDKRTSRFIFKLEPNGSSDLFNLIFFGGKLQNSSVYITDSIARIIGFDCKNYTDSFCYCAPNMYDIQSHRAIVIKIKDLERIDSPNSVTDGAFAIIPLYPSFKIEGKLLTEMHDNINDEDYIKYYNPPLGKLDFLDITLVNSTGQPLDFNGIEHILLFEIKALNRWKKYE